MDAVFESLAGWNDELGIAALDELPVFPSALIGVPQRHYGDVLEDLARIAGVFRWGRRMVLVPERERRLIRAIEKRYGASVRYGEAREYEYATKARAAGVEPRLVWLGHAIQELSHMTPDDMVRLACASPALAAYRWAAIHDAAHRPPH